MFFLFASTNVRPTHTYREREREGERERGVFTHYTKIITEKGGIDRKGKRDNTETDEEESRRMRTGVNFTNILRSAFSYKSFA